MMNSGTDSILTDVTAACTFSPENGTALSPGDSAVSISWRHVKTDEVFTASVPIEVTIPSWADATYEEIATLLDLHYSGRIDLTDYWAVGDERVVPLSSMHTYVSADSAEAGYSGEDTASRNVTITLTHAGGKELRTPINGRTECAFQWDVKEAFPTYSVPYANERLDVCFDDTFVSYDTEDNEGGYGQETIREWLNDEYFGALPEEFRAICKRFKYSHALLVNGTAISGSYVPPVITELDDMIALRVLSEVTEDRNYLDYYGRDGASFAITEEADGSCPPAPFGVI